MFCRRPSFQDQLQVELRPAAYRLPDDPAVFDAVSQSFHGIVITFAHLRLDDKPVPMKPAFHKPDAGSIVFAFQGHEIPVFTEMEFSALSKEDISDGVPYPGGDLLCRHAVNVGRITLLQRLYVLVEGEFGQTVGFPDIGKLFDCLFIFLIGQAAA